ncbi:MAG: hypothetical protein LBG15_08930 [Dysgonamonadaceae bacterium]|jgi:hypothetical protein|nr:hypothetical protein [Dysgonamonadaceae bacterium]
MKNLFYLAILIGGVFYFNSCVEEDPSQAINVENAFPKKAVIEGYAYLNVNKSSTEIVKYAPENTLLSFAIAYNNLGNFGSSGNYLRTTTVDANGYYSIELPTRNDGTPVTVQITGEQIQLTVTTEDGKSKKQIYEILPITQAIVSNFTYLKKLEYTEKEVFQESETWGKGIYRVAFEYYTGKDTTYVPKDTEVRITISKDQFVPKRTNDLVLIKKVGANGLLEFETEAPSLLNGGLTFSLESAFIAKYLTRIQDEEEIYNDYIFNISNWGVIYSGKTIERETIMANRGTQLTNN